MKFKFDSKDEEESFLKSRVESLALSDLLRNRIIDKNILTIRGLLNLTDKDLKKTIGSSLDLAVLWKSLEKLAFDTKYEKRIEQLIDIPKEENSKQLEEIISDSFSNYNDDIVRIFSNYFGVDKNRILGDYRQQELVYIRDLIVCILREYAEMSFPEIGKILGGRDHSTIIHSYRKMISKFKTDEEFRSSLNNLIIKVKAIKDNKINIEQQLIPDLINSIKNKKERANFTELNKIPERNLEVLKLYREGKTLQQLGETFGISRERARQVVKITIEKIAANESISRGVEINADIIFEDEKNKRQKIKIKDRVVKIKEKKEKTWSRYYLACKSCGTTIIPHRRHGLCQDCCSEYGNKKRDNIFLTHSNSCDKCHLSRVETMREHGRDFYLTKEQQVLCRRCFLLKTGKILGSSRIKNKAL